MQAAAQLVEARRVRTFACALALWVGISAAGGPAVAEPDAASGPASIKQGTAAQPLDRPLPRYPSGELKEGREGWVILSYVIEKDGSVDAIVVDDSKGGALFERAAVRAAEQWRYVPAQLDGEPTEQCHVRVLLPFAIDEGNGQRGARRSFVKAYKRAMTAREKGDLAGFQAQVEELAARPKLNLYEMARVSILEATLAANAGDAPAELSHLRRAMFGKGEFLDPDVRLGVLKREFALEVQLRRYASAMETYDELAAILSESEMPEPITRATQKIRALAESGDAFSVSGRLGEADATPVERGVWSHALLRRTVGIASESMDQLEQYDLRCEFHRATGKPKPDRALRIPPEWGKCHIYVFGEPGATFDFIEYGTNLAAS